MLEKRFNTSIGMSIGAQMRKTKTDHIAKLLMETTMSISEIAYAMGFENQANFSRYFQKEFNMKPSQYRKQ
jgi:transcriptional regulator GlxA family with amidase domain